jgi:competence protein ComEC
MKYLLTSLFLTFALIFGAILQVPDNKLHLVFCDVGQGDAILAVKGKNQVLIDGGPSNKVLPCLSNHMPFWDKKIELVVLTHPEADHITGLVPVLERYSVNQILANSLLTDSGVFSKFRELVIAGKIPVYSPKSGDKIKIAEIELDVLFPLEKQGNEVVWKSDQAQNVMGETTYSGNLNKTAIALELKDQDFKALLTGDLGIEEETLLCSFDSAQGFGGLEPVDVLKVGHHGSKYSTSLSFLEEIKPKLAVISVGANNSYGHPATEILQRLNDLGIKILRTDIDGEVEITRDGKTWKVVK